MSAVINVLIAGVGGQGIILAGKLIARAAIASGLDVKTSEIHGMAQRGGSVTTHVRFGEKVLAPVIDPGGADFLLAFEKLEGLRYLDFLKPGGTVVLNNQVIDPLPVAVGAETYPEAAESIIAARFPLVFVDAVPEAENLGNLRVSNMVMIGALARLLPLPDSAWAEAIDAAVPPRFHELNRRAFARGFELAERASISG
ncbi:MAG: indolepyruvate oxidoreductase subunit beta [Ammonifex sp.]|nr:MAG: indolepyruvate oxidoreductase subunit beta [Ammonifex sp.]